MPAKTLTPQELNHALSSAAQWSYELKTFARPNGEATRVIYTEYDLPRPTLEPHDVVTDPEGNAWYSNFGGQTLGRIDPRTGKPYGPTFPHVTLRDMVASQKLLMARKASALREPRTSELPASRALGKGRVGIIDQGGLVAVGPPVELRNKLAAGGSLEELFLKVTQGHPEPT